MNRNSIILVIFLWGFSLYASDAQLLAVVAAHKTSAVETREPVAIAAQVQYPEGSILKTWALKNVLTLAPDQDLYQSPLLGIIAVENGTLKRWYGEFTDVVGDGNKFKRTFVSDTPSELVTRLFFDQLDGKVRSTTLGSNPIIALTSDQVAQWVQLIKIKGIKGFIAVYGKRELKKLGKKENSESVEEREQAKFLQQWFATYQLRPEEGRFSQLGRLRRWVELLSEQLGKLVGEKGEEETQKQFLTLLMAHLYLKNLKESEKSPEYSIARYFTSLGIEFPITFYTKKDKDRIERDLEDEETHYEGTAKDFENMVFYMTALSKNLQYVFLEQPYVSIKYPLSNPRDIPLCVETTLRSMFNIILYNFETKKFDFSLLPEDVQKTIDPGFRVFYEKNADPLELHYYSSTVYEWMDFLFKNVPDVDRGRFIYDLFGSDHNLLKVCNYLFGVRVGNFEEFGIKLSTTTHRIVFKHDYKCFTVEVVNTKDASCIKARIKVDDSIGHIDFSFDSHSIVPLLSDQAFKMVIKLQEKYGIVLTSIALTAQTVNAHYNVNTIPIIKAKSNEVLKVLLESGAVVDDPDEQGRTALYYAALGGDFEKVRLLLDYGATNSMDAYKNTPLKVASERGYIAIVRLMQKKGFEEQSIASNQSDKEAKAPSVETKKGESKPLGKLFMEQVSQLMVKMGIMMP